MYSGHYIGYGSLEGLLEEAERTHTLLYANTLAIRIPSSMGMQEEQSYIQVAFISGEATHFWRWQISSVLRTLKGEFMDADRAGRAEKAMETAWPLILQHLEINHRVVLGTISMPRDLVHMEGHRPEFLAYDHTSAKYLPELSHA